MRGHADINYATFSSRYELTKFVSSSILRLPERGEARGGRLRVTFCLHGAWQHSGWGDASRGFSVAYIHSPACHHTVRGHRQHPTSPDEAQGCIAVFARICSHSKQFADLVPARPRSRQHSRPQSWQSRRHVEVQCLQSQASARARRNAFQASFSRARRALQGSGLSGGCRRAPAPARRAPCVNEHESRAHEATETAGIMSAESSVGVGRGKRLSHDNVVTWRSRKGLGRLRRAGCFAL